MALSYLKPIGLRLASARTRAGMKQDEVAKKLSIQSTTLSAWENGRKRMSLEQLVKLADLYEVQLAYFFPKQKVSTTPSTNDLLRDEIVLKVESLNPLYLDLLRDVVHAFENHDENKGVGFFRSLLDGLES